MLQDGWYGMVHTSTRNPGLTYLTAQAKYLRSLRRQSLRSDVSAAEAHFSLPYFHGAIAKKSCLPGPQ